MNGNILLDTCAAIWITEGARVSGEAEAALDDSLGEFRDVMLSPVTAWEVGMLVARGRYSISMTVQAWFDRMVDRANTGVAELSTGILIQSSFLPGSPPRDPFDRVFIATARAFGYRIMTRDSKILDYAAQGHVKVIPC
jgi:PIN domain nuclease of toxin-antitoxin system